MIIKINNLSKVYYQKQGLRVDALKDINLSFEERGLVFILGKSGSGKSTLLNLIGGLDDFDEGEIYISNQKMSSFNSKQKEHYLNNEVGFVFQNNNLLNEFDVKYNVELPLLMQGKKNNQAKVEEVLTKVGLIKYINSKPNTLSGGEQQRVAIARGIIKEPKILLLDEPTGNLDSVTSKEIFKLLKELSKERLIIVVTHDNESAYSFGTRIIKIDSGRIVDDNNPPMEKEENESFNNTEIKTKHLPFKDIVKISFNFLFGSKIRLFLSFLVGIICLTSTIITSSIILFDPIDSYLNNALNLGVEAFSFNKTYGDTFYRSSSQYETANSDFLPSDLEYFDSLEISYVPRYDIGGIYNLKDDERYYTFAFDSFVMMDDKTLEDYNLHLLAGRMPKEDNEIAITIDAIKEFNKHYGFEMNKDEIKEYFISSNFDNLELTFTSKYLVNDVSYSLDVSIVGIVDTFLEENMMKHKLYDTSHYYDASLYDSIFLNPGFVKRNEDNMIFANDHIVNNISYSTSFFKSSSCFYVDKEELCVPFDTILDMDFFPLEDKEETSTLIYSNDNLRKGGKLYLVRSLIEQEVQDNIVDFAFEQYFYSDIKERLQNDFPSSGHYALYIINETKEQDNIYQEGMNYNYFFSNYINPITEVFKSSHKVAYLPSTIASHIYTLEKYEGGKDEEILKLMEAQIIKSMNIKSVYVADEISSNMLYLPHADFAFFQEYDSKAGSSSSLISTIYLPFTKNYFQDINTLNIVKNRHKTGVLDYQISYDIVDDITMSLRNQRRSINDIYYQILAVFIVSLIIVIGFLLYYYYGVIKERSKNIGILKAMGLSKVDLLIIFSLIGVIYFIFTTTIALLLGYILIPFFNTFISVDCLSLILFNFKTACLLIGVSLCANILGIVSPLRKINKLKTSDVISERK